MWKHVTDGFTGLSFYNNHLDSRARFYHFVEDGATTNRGMTWPVGEKGKGFILATQYLIERIEKNMDKRDAEAAKNWKPKVSFRVGHAIGEFSWRENRDEKSEQLLRVSKDDLSPLNVTDFIRCRGEQ